MANYISPTWVNNQAPKLNASNLQALTDTVEESQVLRGNGAPTVSTAGVVGQRYADESTEPKTIYICTAEDGLSYTWEKEATREDISDLSELAETATSYALKAYNSVTVSGEIVSFADGADAIPVVDLSVAIDPVQEGTGDPSPENIRPISGWTELTFYHSGADTSSPEELAVSWEDEAGTVYGGTLDLTTGALTVTRGIVDFGDLTWNKSQNTNASWAIAVSGPLAAMKRPASNSVPVDAICSEYKAVPASGGHSDYQIYYNVTSGSVYFGLYNSNFAELTTSEIKTALTGVKMVFALDTPVTYQLTPMQVLTLLGENNLWADTGDVMIKYLADPNLYIDRRLNELASNLATVEPGNTASRNYSAGAYLVCGGVLNRAITAIASGETLVPGTNITSTTVGDELVSLEN